jgi:hypothetical protein
VQPAGHQPDKAEALADILIKRHPGYPNGYIVRACNLMDRNLPDVYDTLTALTKRTVSNLRLFTTTSV